MLTLSADRHSVTLTPYPVKILFVSHSTQLEPAIFEYYMSLIPPGMQKPIRKFLRWQDAQLSLFGKLLLMEGLSQSGMDKALIEKVQYTSFNRPYLPGNLHFNISHSGSITVCAISNQYRLGIDVELIKQVNIEEFTDQFTIDELMQIRSAASPLREFYRWWTKKEALVKVDGKGLSINLKEIKFITPGLAEIENNQWHLHEVFADHDYCCHLATDCGVKGEIKIQKFDLPGEL